MAEELKLRFAQADSVFRLNHARWSDADIARLLDDYIERSRLQSPWILDSRQEGSVFVVEHLFPVDEFVEMAAGRMSLDEHFIESIPLTYPITFEIRAGYLRMHKPLAVQYGGLVSDFIRGLGKMLVQSDEKYLWDHGYAECGGVGSIPFNVYGLLEPDEPLVGFYRVDVDMEHEAWLFITPQGIIVHFDNDEVLAFDKVDMRNPSVPSGFFSYSMLKVGVLGLQGSGPVKTSFSPKDLGELDQARADIRTMLASPHQGHTRRMVDPCPHPWLEVEGDEPDYMAQANLERYRGDSQRAGRNPFSDAAGQMFTAMDNPFA
ncbi:hypothetical protein [Corynebacterium minutissimum]|uniref:hypothetical protein n=1 Tax=Corynebacterium minutissimum TaxID=38301 RepID=UPI001EF2FDBC|nr:hypothetical protein [Corynebacterium minutissimum]MCG7229267.1 hypothetical protein [Corynebacterium minutissimum]MCG7238257.1 hypothetical protein [Corynebacterium minutissimum]